MPGAKLTAAGFFDERQCMARLKIAVVMGGPGDEREVSIASGTGVLRALTALGHDAQSLDFDRGFVDAMREIAPDLVFNALHGTAARTVRSKVCSSGWASRTRAATSPPARSRSTSI